MSNSQFLACFLIALFRKIDNHTPPKMTPANLLRTILGWSEKHQTIKTSEISVPFTDTYFVKSFFDISK